MTIKSPGGMWQLFYKAKQMGALNLALNGGTKGRAICCSL